jgi:hypothetical protein
MPAGSPAEHKNEEKDSQPSFSQMIRRGAKIRSLIGNGGQHGALCPDLHESKLSGGIQKRQISTDERAI